MNKKIGVFSVATSFIGMGIIMLTRNFYDFDVFKAISMMIAVILIVLGLEFIYYTNRYKDVEVRVSGKSIITLFLVCGFAFTIAGITEFFDHVGDVQFNKLYDFDDLFTTEQVSKTYTIASGDYTNIEVDNSMGKVYIKGDAVDDITVATTLHYNNWIDGTPNLDNLIDLTYVGDTINIQSILPNSNGFNLNSFSMSFVITVPEDFSTTIENRHGNVEVAAISGPVKVDNAHGNVSIHSIQKDLTVNNSHDDVLVDDIGGNVYVTNQHSETAIYNIAGNVEATTSHDPIVVENVTGDVRLKNSHGDATAKNITGIFNLNISHGEAYLAGISDVTVNGSFTEVNFDQDDILHHLYIKTEHDDVSVNIPKQDYQLNLSAEYGDIDTDLDLNINEETNLETYSGKIGDGTSDINIITTHGDIDLYVKNAG
ncbi:DUF4097 family beta strand repeat-containing protein [Vallitalea okinawensis]|uniref:hypothetical protein n=1 Tax=Vallitalea okinawensis TaxID=2078660 RepID=UPI000CFE0ABC|nr:hypothetical protein [Vallitalea okinawensis]